MENINIAEDKFKFLFSEVKNDIASIISEEDAKIKIINRIFNECLGWSYTQFFCENQHANGFSDYILKIGDSAELVVEAKRIGKIGIESITTDKHRSLKISGSALKPSIDGIKQAHSYASDAGIPIAVVTDGITWIIFKTMVLGGYREKEAFVFPSLDAIKNSFSIFYELLSYENFINKTYNSMFDQIHNNRQQLTLPFTAAIESHEINILKKSPISFDLEKIFNNFFTQLIGDKNSEIMTECFVESNESQIADYSLEKITNSVLNNLPRDHSHVGTELSSLITGNVKAELPADSDLSVFIVGPTGSGKTTYIDRFFSKILPKSTRDQCLTLSINCLDASGDESHVMTWMTEAIIKSIESKLFTEEFPEYNDLKGMYYSEYRQMSSGYLKKIFENDKVQFDVRFANFLEDEVRKNREGYLEKLLHFTINNRKKLPIIIVDNMDEFTIDYKEKIFQLCNAYRRKVKLCMLIFPVTDKSAWSFSKTDIFTIHQSRSFFLPTPAPREVFRKRIDFLNKKLIMAETKERKEYLSSRGIRIEFKDLSKFAQVLEDVFVENNFTAKTLGELTNYNIRSIMNLSKRIITSPVMKIEDLITSFVTTEPINFTKFIDALLRGDYEAYKSSTGEEFNVISTFKVNTSKAHSPLLILRILALLRVTKHNGRNVEERHLTVQSIINYFEALGIDSLDIELCLKELVFLKLIEPYDPSTSFLHDSQKLAITYKGLAHYDLSTTNNVYFYQMALTTGISNPEVAQDIRNCYLSDKSIGEKTSYIRKKFSEYLIQQDKKYFLETVNKDQFDCQNDLIKNIFAFSQSKNIINRSLSNNYLEYLGKKLVGKVKKYDPERDYGSIYFKETNDDFSLRIKNLDKFEVDNIFDGDIIYFTLGQNERGIHIKSIDGFVENSNDFHIEKCVIKIYKSEQAYGFAFIGNTSNEAFFHKTAFPQNFSEHLRTGLEFEAEVRLNDNGKYQVRKCLKLIHES